MNKLLYPQPNSIRYEKIELQIPKDELDQETLQKQPCVNDKYNGDLNNDGVFDDYVYNYIKSVLDEYAYPEAINYYGDGLETFNFALQWNTWQEAYNAILNHYNSQPLNYDLIEEEWLYALHELVPNTPPILFILMQHSNGAVSYRGLYYFDNSRISPFILDNVSINGSLFFLQAAPQYVFTRDDVGFGVSYQKIIIKKGVASLQHLGYYRPTQYVLDTAWETFDIRTAHCDLLYFYLWEEIESIDEGVFFRITAFEFEGIFGMREERTPINKQSISEHLR